MNAPASNSPATSTDSHWASPEQVVFAQLCFTYLLISPSYELARKHRKGLLTQADQAKLPADIDVVLGVFDMLGDLKEIAFGDWWRGKGIAAFGNEGARPFTYPIDAIWPTKGNLVTSLNERMNGYLAGQFQEQDPQVAIIMAIPLTLSKSVISEQIKDFIDEIPERIRNTPRRAPNYPLHGNKQDLSGMNRYMKCAMSRIEFPDIPLWQIGVLAQLSTTYSTRLAMGKGTPEDQQSLKMLASRALKRAGLIAENAARGLFPTYDPCEHAIKPDWSNMGDVFEDCRGWSDGLEQEDDL